MAEKHLGEVFDIHGGGIDLVFPHHENEIAQSRCAHDTPLMARFWLHNGFLQVEGEKMSKSLGNFITIHELLAAKVFGGRSWHGEVVRLAMLMTHYRQPIDWTARALEDAQHELSKWAAEIIAAQVHLDAGPNSRPTTSLISALSDDLNTPAAITVLRSHYEAASQGQNSRARDLLADLAFLGVIRPDKLFVHMPGAVVGTAYLAAKYRDAVAELKVCVANGFPRRRDEIVQDLKEQGVRAAVLGDGHIRLEAVNGSTAALSRKVDALISERNAARKTKNFKEADRIRDELAAMGIALKDSKDPKTGEIVTTWEVRASGPTEAAR
jgi:cysteinyl-tRNA synthetase